MGILGYNGFVLESLKSIRKVAETGCLYRGVTIHDEIIYRKYDVVSDDELDKIREIANGSDFRKVTDTYDKNQKPFCKRSFIGRNINVYVK